MYPIQPPNLNYIRDIEEYIPNNTDVCQLFLNDLELRLMEFIESSSYVVGCMCWLTSTSILSALQKKKGVKIIVAKEYYLNPKLNSKKSDYHVNTRKKYDQLPDPDKSTAEILFPDIVIPDGAIVTFGDPREDRRMHHKFLIFFNDDLEIMGCWTGSYNATTNGSVSLENAVYLRDRDIAVKLLNEVRTIMPLCEHYLWQDPNFIRPENLTSKMTVL
jgi:hypothetical protein